MAAEQMCRTVEARKLDRDHSLTYSAYKFTPCLCCFTGILTLYTNMNQSTSDSSTPNSGSPDLTVLIIGVVAGDPEQEAALYEILKQHLRVSVAQFFDKDSLETDEVVVESITAVFQYICRDKGFSGDLIRFAITIARNRCRNIVNQRKRRPQVPIEPLADWIANGDRSPLDHLLAEESQAQLQQAITELGRVCRLLLRAFYFEQTPIEVIRRRLGLDTVQGVYYRRTVCLRELGDRIIASS